MLRRMSHRLKKATEIDEMRLPSRLVAQALALARKAIRPGVTTGEIDRIIEDFFAIHSAKPLFKGYPGEYPFPAVACISVNEEVVHGIPGNRILQPGDIVSIDTGCSLNGWCGDSAISVCVGEVSPAKQRLIQVAEETLKIAIQEMGRLRKWSQVARIMQDFVHAQGYSVVEQFVGHGIGRAMHEEPQVPNFYSRDWRKHDFWLDEGLVIAVEPMVNMGTKEVQVLGDKWTVVTCDGKPSVHVEHTIAITSRGIEVLTSRQEFE